MDVRTDRRHGVRLLAAAAIAGQVVYTATWVIAGLVEPGFRFADNDTSDLGALTARHALPYDVVVCVSGAAVVGLAVALAVGARRARWVLVGALLIGVSGVGQVIDGLAREDCPASVDRSCLAAEKAGRVSVHHQVHNVESLVTFLALVLAPFALALAFRARDGVGGSGLTALSVLVGVVQAVTVAGFLVMYEHGSAGQGLVEMAQIVTASLWLCVLAAWLLARGADTG